MQNSPKDNARKKKSDLPSACHSMTLGHNSDGCKQALLVCSFQGRVRGKHFSSRDYGITGDQEHVQMRRNIGTAVVNTLTKQPELSVQL